MHVLLAGKPWCRSPDQINRLGRAYVLEVLFHPRDEKGQPVFPEEPATDWLEDLAIRRGLPAPQAQAWVQGLGKGG